MHRRFLCSVCGLKWFTAAAHDAPARCSGCGGVLVPLHARTVVAHDPASERPGASGRSAPPDGRRAHHTG